MVSYFMAMATFALSFNVCDKLENQIKYQNFDHENEAQGQGEKWDLRHSTENIRINISDFFS